jgi:hypothetical protein
LQPSMQSVSSRILICSQLYPTRITEYLERHNVGMM